MSEIAKKHSDQLARIKQNVENAYDSFLKNYERYNKFRNFVFVTTISETERSVLTELRKPQIEFNILEAYISRLCGEFSKSVPSIKISAKDGKEVDGKLIELIEGHIRYILKEANKQGLEYNCYRDTLSGGFSCMKIYTEYSGEMSFHQDIVMRRVYDPTLVGFDPLASLGDKSDAEYCFEIVPKRFEDFKRENPGLAFKDMKFSRRESTAENLGPFQWSIKSGKDDLVLVADYYEKKKVKKTIVLLADGQVMTTKEYDEFVEQWKMEGRIEQPPIIIGKPRTTEIIKIVRYKVIENQVFDYEETDFKRLPLIFIDGNSIIAKQGTSGQVSQMTRPYIYQAVGAQKLKNFAGQSLANELENMGPQKTVVALESIPDNYLDGYTDPQNTIIQVYNAFHNGDVNVPLPPPIQPTRPQIPPEISNAFMAADSIVQNVLGSFDATMSKLTEQQISGIAIQESITLSNSAAMPYVYSYLLGLQSAAQMAIDMIPLYIRTPRTIPVINSEGKKSYVKVNQDGGISLDYDHDAIQVSVEAGVSFNVQQSKALQQIIALMNASPLFSEFINESGLDIILDNVEIRNIESLRERSEQWMQKRMQQKQQAMEQAKQQPQIEQQMVQIAAQQVQSENQVGMAKVQLQAATEQTKAQIKQAELEMDAQKNQTELIKVMADIQLEEMKLGLDRQKQTDERLGKILDAKLKQSEHHHKSKDMHFDQAMRSLENIQAQEQARTAADSAMEEIAKGD